MIGCIHFLLCRKSKTLGLVLWYESSSLDTQEELNFSINLDSYLTVLQYALPSS